jgi:methylmalonyl-CoA carboxyltransferase small subunit
MKLTITVEGKKYEVEVEVAEETPSAPVTYVGGQRAASGGPARAARSSAPPASSVSDDKAIKSPLAGNVSEIQVKVGDEVAVDQPVLVLEAMKMLTTITAPVAGKIGAVEVAVGDAVKQGQVLIGFE